MHPLIPEVTTPTVKPCPQDAPEGGGPDSRPDSRDPSPFSSPSLRLSTLPLRGLSKHRFKSIKTPRHALSHDDGLLHRLGFSWQSCVPTGWGRFSSLLST